MGGVWRARLETRCEIRYATRRSRNVQRGREGSALGLSPSRSSSSQSSRMDGRMDFGMEGRVVAPLTATYGLAHARAPLAARREGALRGRDSIFCGVVFELAIVVVIEELS